MTWQLSLLMVALCLASQPAASTKPPVEAKKPGPRPAQLRTYRFTAKIFYNGGVTPFKVGTKITGHFTYDLSAKNESKLKWQGLYRSPRNKIEIRYGKWVFSSQDEVRVGVSFSKARYETLGIAGGKPKLPKGWRSEPDSFSGEDKSSFGLLLQNRPARGILSGIGIPDRLDSWQRFKTHIIVLDFADGVRFPEGSVKKRATVYAKIEQLKPHKPKPVAREEQR